MTPGVRPWHPLVQRVNVGGTVLRVGTSGDGPPLLLVNGIGGNLEMWGPLAQHLATRRLVAFDFPGTGQSPALLRRARMPALAQLLVRLLDVLELEQPDVLGYSWGGALAQEVARARPDRVRSLVLAATTPGLGGRPPAPWVVAAMVTPLRYWSPTYLRLVSPMVYGTTVGRDEQHVAARRAGPPSARGYAQQLYAISGWSSLPWLRQLQTRTLVLAGRGDRLAPVRNARLLAARIPDASLRVLDGGHLFLLQNPKPCAVTIDHFLGR